MIMRWLSPCGQYRCDRIWIRGRRAVDDI